jgi:hypothetical protein
MHQRQHPKEKDNCCRPAGPNSQQRRCGLTNHRHLWHWPTRQRQQANYARAAQNFPPILTIMPMEFQLQHIAVKGTPVVSLNTVTRVVHIRLLARQIHNGRTLPTTVATLLAHLRRSLPARLTALSPPQPCSSPAHRFLRDDSDTDAITGVRMSSRPT